MDSHRPIAWRALLATATVGLAAAGFGGACAAQDGRDGTSQGAYEGRYLSWSGKTEPAPRPQAVAAPADEAAPPAEDEAPPPIASHEVASRYASDTVWAPSRYGAERSQAAAVDTPEVDTPEPARAYRADAYRGPAPETYRAPAPEPSLSQAAAAAMRAAPPSPDEAPATAPSELFPSYASDASRAPQAPERSRAPVFDAPATAQAHHAAAYRGPAPETYRAPAPEAQPPSQAAAMRAAPPGPDETPATPPSELFPSYASDSDSSPFPSGPERSRASALDAPATAQAYHAAASEAPHQQAQPSAQGPSEPPSAPPPAPYRQAANTATHMGGDTGVRFYSVHRQFGMAPDPIPEPTEGHTVLIGPPDHASAADAPDDAQGDADAPPADATDQVSGGADADGNQPAAAKPHHASGIGDH